MGNVPFAFYRWPSVMLCVCVVCIVTSSHSWQWEPHMILTPLFIPPHDRHRRTIHCSFNSIHTIAAVFRGENNSHIDSLILTRIWNGPWIRTLYADQVLWHLTINYLDEYKHNTNALCTVRCVYTIYSGVAQIWGDVDHVHVHTLILIAFASSPFRECVISARWGCEQMLGR